jgi:DNA-binding phage protein
MSKTAVLTRRLVRVVTIQQEQAVQRYLTETARELNVNPAELLAEYQRVIQRFRAVGAVTRVTQLAIVADELGISVEELEAEVAAIEAGMMPSTREKAHGFDRSVG